ncbi:MAG: hypothetical protein BGO76_00880 [Caedibacter sp. 38-128]|nr:MAG: hypothetical protein BGO76_00880 [Caedibacter sp. 38-128]
MASYQAYCSSIARNLTEYDYEDIREFSKLCDVAYGKTSLYLEKLQDNHWDIDFLSTNPLSSPYGIKACNGPLTVIAYTGTNICENIQTFLADAQIARAECGHLFPELKGKGIFHRGIGQFYTDLKDYRTVKLLKDFDPDEKLVLAGHSLGGALAVCGAIDLLYGQQHRSEVYPTKFCSLMTLGCPAFLDSSFRSYLDQSFTETSHLRLFFDQDPVSNFTRGPQGSPFNFQETSLETGAYVHSGFGLALPGEGFISHSCHEYIKFIDRRPPTLETLWPIIDEESFVNSFQSIELSSYQISLIQKNYRNPKYSSKAKKLVSLLHYQSSHPRLSVDSRYSYWRLALDSSLKPKHRLNRFEDFCDSYVGVNKENHPRVFQLSRKLIEQNSLPAETLLIEVLNGRIYTPDPQQKKEFIELCELLLVKNNYDRDLIYFPRGASGVLEYERFNEEHVDKAAYTAFKKRTLIRLIKDPNATFLTRFHDLLTLMNIELKENPIQPKITEEEREKIAEDKAFMSVRESYTSDYILNKIKILTGQNIEAFAFISNALNKLYQNEPLSTLMKTHLRSYFSKLQIDFNGVYFKEYEQIKEENSLSLIDILKKLPETSAVFDYLVRDMKKRPHLLDEFFNDPLIQAYNFKDELLQYMKNIF